LNSIEPLCLAVQIKDGSLSETKVLVKNLAFEATAK
jgi:hypothetical protein